MDEKKYAVLLTDMQEIKVLECDPQQELFDVARDCIGCDWIELVDLNPDSSDGCVMLIDEEGKLRNKPASINCVASDLYGSGVHGDPIVGNAVLVRATDDSLELMTSDAADKLAARLTDGRDAAIEKISRAFGIRPVPVNAADKVDPARRQSCRKNDMER